MKNKIKIFFRLFRESLGMAVQALLLNKMRSFLSLLMIAIGIFSIVLIRSIVDSMEHNVKSSFESFGQNVLYIQKWPWSFSGDYPWWKYMNRPQATYKESQELEERLKGFPYVSNVAFMIQLNNKSVKRGGNNMTGIGLTAVSHDYDRINAVTLSGGRYFSENDSRLGNPVIILGYHLAQGLFEGEDPLGKEVQLMGRKLTVIGVVREKGKSMLGGSEDDMAILPVRFLRKTAGLRYGDPSILVKISENVSLDEVEAAVVGQMRAIRRTKPSEDDNFSVNRMTMLTKMVDSVFGAMGTGGAVMGFFALLVGGFGIANVMFVSVKERTNIIGIQKSLGAKNSFILLQFLTEATLLSLVGGLLGIVLVFAATYIAAHVLDFDMLLSLGNVLYGSIISAFIGLLAGLIPALIAARLNPVEAIRSKV